MNKMLNLFFAASVILGCTSFAAAQNNASKDINLTVYNQNFGLVREIRSFSLPKGVSHIQFDNIPREIVPGSIMLQTKVEVIDQSYHRRNINTQEVLKDYFLNKSVQLIGDSGEMINGILKDVNGGQAILQRKDGSYLMIPNIRKYKLNLDKLPDGLSLSPYLECVVNSSKSQHEDMDLLYQTRGIRWAAVYSAVVNTDYDHMNLTANADLENNSGADFHNVKVKLVAGDVHLSGIEPQQRNEAMGQVMKLAQSVTQKPFADYHLYDITGKINLDQNVSKQIELFRANNVSIKKNYTYNDGGHYAVGHEVTGKIRVQISFKNTRNNKLGKPMPAGTVNIYKKDDNSLILIGLDHINHTPVENEVTWEIGKAFDLKVHELLKEMNRISNRVSDRTYEITFSNQKKDPVIIEVNRNIGTNGEIRQASQQYEKVDATTVRFYVTVRPKGSTILTYTVRNTY
jgi:hypothetical protein